MVKILFVNPLNTDVFNNHMQERLQSVVSSRTSVDVVSLSMPDEAPTLILPDQPFYMGELFKVLWRGQEDGYDALVIGCAADPGLQDARKMLSIPVIAPLEAGLCLASMIAERFSIITPRPSSLSGFVGLVWEKARQYGLKHRIASVRSDGVAPPSPEEINRLTQTDPNQAKRAVLNAYEGAISKGVAEQARKAIEDDGAQALFFACTFWTGMLEPIKKDFNVPLLDAGTTSILAAESIAHLCVKRM